MDFFQSLFFNDVVLTFQGFSLDALGNAALLAGAAGAQWWLILHLAGRLVVTLVIVILQCVDGRLEAALLVLVVLNRTLNCVLILNAHHFLTLGLLHQVVQLASWLLS